MRQMWVSWSTPSTGRYLFLSQAHYWGCHAIQVGFWNMGRSQLGSKWACARRKGIGLTGGVHAWHSGWRQRQAQGMRQEEQRHHSPTLPVVTERTVLPSPHEHCAHSQVKSEASLERPETCSLTTVLPIFFPSNFMPLNYFPKRVAEVF